MRKYRKPLIGITPQYDPEQDRTWIQHTYLNAVSAAGGIPLVVDLYADEAMAEDLCEKLDGVLLTGGADIHPFYYREPIDALCGYVCRHRDRLDKILVERAEYLHLPILGICRGMQSINVFSGGSLHQHIPNHMQSIHDIIVDPDSLLFRILGDGRISVNSFHHQCVKEIPSGYRACARTAEGDIEAIEWDGVRFCLGVQWHPEKENGEASSSGFLFAAFIEACMMYAQQKRRYRFFT